MIAFSQLKLIKNVAGQLTSYHDCLLHNQPDADFTAFMDLDELPFVTKYDGTFVSWLQRNVDVDTGQLIQIQCMNYS